MKHIEVDTKVLVNHHFKYETFIKFECTQSQRLPLKPLSSKEVATMRQHLLTCPNPKTMWKPLATQHAKKEKNRMRKPNLGITPTPHWEYPPCGITRYPPILALYATYSIVSYDTILNNLCCHPPILVLIISYYQSLSKGMFTRKP